MYSPIFLKTVREHLFIQHLLSTIKANEKYKPGEPRLLDFEWLMSQSAAQIKRIDSISQSILQDVHPIVLDAAWHDYWLAYEVQRTLYALVVKKYDVLAEPDKAPRELPILYEMQLADEEKPIFVQTAVKAGSKSTVVPTIARPPSKTDSLPTAKLAVTPYMRKSILMKQQDAGDGSRLKKPRISFFEDAPAAAEIGEHTISLSK